MQQLTPQGPQKSNELAQRYDVSPDVVMTPYSKGGTVSEVLSGKTVCEALHINYARQFC